MLISENLKLIREALGLTQGAMGTILGATAAMVRFYEAGKAEPKQIFIDKLSALIRLPQDYIKDWKVNYDEIEIDKRVVDALKLIFEIKGYESSIEDSEDISKIDEVKRKNYIARRDLTTMFNLTMPEVDDLVKLDYFSVLKFIRDKYNSPSLTISSGVTKTPSHPILFPDLADPSPSLKKKTFPEIVVSAIDHVIEARQAIEKYNQIKKDVEQIEDKNGEIYHECQKRLKNTRKKIEAMVKEFRTIGILIKDTRDFSLEKVISTATYENTSFFSSGEEDIKEVQRIYEEELENKKNEIEYYLNQIFLLKQELRSTKKKR